VFNKDDVFNKGVMFNVWWRCIMLLKKC